MPRESHEALQDAITSMRATPIPIESMNVALERAMQIEIPRPVERANDRNHDIRETRINRKPTFAGIAASLLVLSASLAAGLWLLGGQDGIAHAELQRAMEHLDSVHVVIKSTQDRGDDDIQVWFKRGVGFAMHSPFGIEIDNGKQSFTYYRSRKVAIRSKSRIGENQFADAQRLGKAMDFYIDDVPKSLPHLSEADLTIDGEPCRAYVWNQEDNEFPQPEADEIPEELWPNQRTVFLIDEDDHLRRCDHQRGLDGTWKTYRTVEISYENDIPLARFIPDFPDDVKIVDANDQGLEIDPEVAALAAGIEKRHAAYRSIKFSYDATIEIKPSPESQFPQSADQFTVGKLQTRDTLTILSPTEGQPNRLWRRWTQHVEDLDDEWRLHRFAAFDGNQTRSFWRPNYRPWQQGLIAPWEEWDTFSENHFDEFLFLRINGQSDVDPAPPDVRDLFLNRYHVVGRRKSEGREIVTLHGSSSPEFGVEYHVDMTSEPDFMILRWEARYALRKNQRLILYVVTKVGDVDGLSYPAQGYFRQLPIRESKDIKYRFHVTAAEPLGEDARDKWHPAWPTGTLVRDVTKEKQPTSPEAAD